MTEAYFEATKQAEIYLRGRTLQISAIIEALLAHILIISRADEKDWKGYRFDKLKFHNKIEVAAKLLKEKFPDIYSENQALFNELMDLKEIRNKIAHCKFDWDIKNPQTITIWDDAIVEEDESGDKIIVSYWKAEKHLYKDIVEVIEQLKKKAISLNNIVKSLRIDFDNRFPGVLNLSFEI